jgi:hypothetical protein
LQGAAGKDLGKVELRWALASVGSLCRFEPVGFWMTPSGVILSPDSGISKTKRSSNVISPNGLLSSLWVWQHKDESNPFLFATENSSHHVLFEQRLKFKRVHF